VASITVFSSPPGSLLPNPVPGGDPPFAPAWVIGSEVYIDAMRAAEICAQYLDLAKRFVTECSTRGGEPTGA